MREKHRKSAEETATLLENWARQHQVEILAPMPIMQSLGISIGEFRRAIKVMHDRGLIRSMPDRTNWAFAGVHRGVRRHWLFKL